MFSTALTAFVDALLASVSEQTADAGLVVAELAEARRDFATSLLDDSLFSRLVQLVDLGVAEAEVFAVVCAIDLDSVEPVASDDRASARRLTLRQIDRLFGPSHCGPLALSPDSMLVSAALIDVATAGSWASRSVGIPERVAWYLLGDDSTDIDLPIGVEWFAAPPDQDAEHDLILVVGTDPTRRLQQAVHSLVGEQFISTIPPQTDEVWRALVREATVTASGLIVTVDDGLPPMLRHWIERTPHLAWAVLSSTELVLSGMPHREWVEIEAMQPGASERELLATFGDEADEPLRSRRLSAHQLRLVAQSADGVGGYDTAVRRLVSGPIERLARRIRPRVGWDDLILPPDSKAQLRELTARYRNRGVVYGEWGVSQFPSPGVIALFAGPSGTGKTTAAEVIADELGVDLFKVEVAAVISKYIGETEKNLEELFTAAEAGDLVLCFDEADSLIGKRSDVKDARDRYANIEVSYLLQRFETYSGFIVLTTNLQQNIDDAFLRRVHARVSFANPGPGERLAMWQRSLAGVPQHEPHLDDIAARFDLSGGTIRNAALGAAFLAAGAGTPVGANEIVLAVRREYQKLGRLCTKELFGPWFSVIDGR